MVIVFATEKVYYYYYSFITCHCHLTKPAAAAAPAAAEELCSQCPFVISHS